MGPRLQARGEAPCFFNRSPGAWLRKCATLGFTCHAWGGKQDPIITPIAYQGSSSVSADFYLDLKILVLPWQVTFCLRTPHCAFILMNEVIPPSVARQSSEELEREQKLNLQHPTAWQHQFGARKHRLTSGHKASEALSWPSQIAKGGI